jgi:DUF1009 family protein
MVEAKSAVLAVEAGTAFVLEREKTVALADANSIAIVGVTRDAEN